MSKPSYRFDGDDVAVGPNFAILTAGPRRVLLEKLSADQLRWLDDLSRNGSRDLTEIDKTLFQVLLDGQLISPVGGDAQRTSRGPLALRLRARTVARLAKPFVPLTTVAGLILCLGLVATVLLFAPAGLESPRHIPTWFSRASFTDLAALVGAFALLALLHELGHAAACLRVTGVAGGIRLATYRGLPALAADVSSLCRTSPRGRALIAVSGSTLQAAAAAVLLCVPSETARLTATAALASAAFNLVPLPDSDGYWFLRDLLALELRPRLIRTRRREAWSDIAYGYFLVLATAALCVTVAYQSGSIYSFLTHMFASSSFRILAFLVIFFYSAFVIINILLQNGRMFRKS